jgi:muramoyltetrapeptide carboxypeptidase
VSVVLRRPPALGRGAVVAIVAPASPFDRRYFDAGTAELRALGFRPVWDERLFARDGYVAGSATLRATALSEAWHSPDVAGVMAARGGYGSVQVLPRLDLQALAADPKVFIGYSDLTTLLIALVCHAGLVAFHGPSVIGRLSEGIEHYDRASLVAAITRTQPMGELTAPGLETLYPGEARGRLLGGTLTQLAAAVGTPWELRAWDDTILLLEDVGERPYRLDRMLEQLRLGGALQRVRGVVLGTFPDCDEPSGEFSARATLADKLGELGVPVLFGFPTGHVEGAAMTVPLGVNVRLVAGARPALVVEEGAVV